MRTLLFMVKTIPGTAIRPPDRPPGTRKRSIAKRVPKRSAKYKKKKSRRRSS